MIGNLRDMYMSNALILPCTVRICNKQDGKVRMEILEFDKDKEQFLCYYMGYNPKLEFLSGTDKVEILPGE